MHYLLILASLALFAVCLGSAAFAAEEVSVGARRLNDAAARFSELRHRFVEGLQAGPLPAFAATDKSPVRFSGMQMRPSHLRTPVPTDGFAATQRARLGEFVVHELERLGRVLDRKLQTHWYYKRLEDVNDVERALGPLGVYINGYLAFDECVSRYGKDPYVVYRLDPTCGYPILPGGVAGHNEETSYFHWGSADVGSPNPQILPRTFPAPASPSRSLAALGCRGQYIPVSFAVQAGEEMKDLRFEVSALKDDEATLGSEIVDLRVVEAWWRPYLDHKTSGEFLMPTLQNELLVHNDEFVTADLDKPFNRFKETKYPNDLPELSPVTIAADHTRQFWATVHLPEDARAGRYEGVIKAAGASGHQFELTLTVEVLPFELEPTPYAYGFYYPSLLRDEETAKEQGVHSWKKTTEQMKKEFVNMARHELNTLCIYGGIPTKTEDGWDFSKLEGILEMARQAGLTRSPFVWLGHRQYLAPMPDRAGAPKTIEEAVDNLTRFTRAVNAFCDEKGYPRPAIYGHDEVSGEKLQVLKKTYGAVTAAGGIVAQACSSGYYDDIGDALSLPIVYGEGSDYVSTGLANMLRSQEHGYETWIYNCPATDMGGSPSLFRRRYGLAMWRNSEDGAFPWEYSGLGLKGPYMERPAGRLYAVTHPTWDGDPIDTIIYEAFREGIYDTRYMATLEKHLRLAKDRNAAPELVAKIEKWLASFSINDDLQQLRRQMTDFIVALSRETGR
jgi:hypothetical protein